jgi:hypothetical protein
LLHNCFFLSTSCHHDVFILTLKAWAKLLYCWSLGERSPFSKRRYFGESSWKRWVLRYKIQFWSTSCAGSLQSLFGSSFALISHSRFPSIYFTAMEGILLLQTAVCNWFLCSAQEMYKQSTTVSGLTPKTQLAVAAADSAGCHRDAILALASFNLSSQRLISASRDGAVKVWK